MQLYFLGTGAGIPSRYRNVSSLALLWPEYKGQTWLFDCGEATQHQIMDSPIKLTKVNRIFITHLHGDHLYGLPGVLGSRSFQGAETKLTLYGPKGIKEYVRASLEISHTYLRYPLEIIEVEPRTYQLDSSFTIEVKRLEHGIPCYGYRITEADHPGQLDAKRLKEMGIPPGPVYRELKQGKSVTLEDGRVLYGPDFLADPKKGRIITILGDTRYTDNSVALARNAVLLVHESTYRAHQQELAASYFHSTTIDAARVAKEAGVRHLILTHISSRFSEDECQELLREAVSVFPDTRLAHDHFSFELER